MGEINQKNCHSSLKKKIITSRAQWELCALWNIITTVRSLLPCSWNLNVYYITLLLKNQGTGCASAAVGGNIAWHIHVEKCACINSNKNKLRWKEGRRDKNLASHKTRWFGGPAHINHNCPSISLGNLGHLWVRGESVHGHPLRKDLKGCQQVLSSTWPVSFRPSDFPKQDILVHLRSVPGAARTRVALYKQGLFILRKN